MFTATILYHTGGSSTDPVQMHRDRTPYFVRSATRHPEFTWEMAFVKGLGTYPLCISSLPNVQCLNSESFKLSNFSEIFQLKQLQVFCHRTATRHPEFTWEVDGFHERFRYLSFIYLQLTKCPVPKLRELQA